MPKKKAKKKAKQKKTGGKKRAKGAKQAAASIAEGHADPVRLADDYRRLCKRFAIAPCSSVVDTFDPPGLRDGFGSSKREPVDTIHIDTTLNDFKSWMSSRHAGEGLDDVQALVDGHQQVDEDDLDPSEQIPSECYYCGSRLHTRNLCPEYLQICQSVPVLPRLMPAGAEQETGR